MSHGYDEDWWKKAKAESIERRKRASAITPSGDAILVVTEGTVTEPTYFKALRAKLRLATVRFEIVPGHTSAPLTVVRTAASLASEQIRKSRRGELSLSAPRKFDQTWAVLDTDVPVVSGTWPDVVAEAAQLGVLLASSTPCFEFWLVLHLKFCTPYLATSLKAQQYLEGELGHAYRKDAPSAATVVERILNSWSTAVKNAQRVRQYHIENNTAHPANSSSEVDQLVLALNSAAASPYRISV
jgi:hypothetical protein